MIVITGASGRIGRRTAELLASTGQCLRLMSREPGNVPALRNAESVYGDFSDRPSLDAAFAGAETVLVISGSAPPGERAELHRNAFEAAKRANAAHVVYLSLEGAARDSKYPYSRDHYQSEEYLAQSGVPFTVLRDAFYMEMFVDLFDGDGVVRGPAGQRRGAFVSREDVARTAAAVVKAPPGGIHDVTGPEALTVAEVALQLSTMTGRKLRFEDESAESMRSRLSETGTPELKIELSVGWFKAIGAGELERPSDTVRRFTGTAPLSLEGYFFGFPELLRALRV
jgi:NAD(P)H dehydrogenase (quinone)